MKKLLYEIGLHAALLLVVLLTTLVTYNDPSTIRLAADSSPRRAFHNFHRVETRQDTGQAFRWTTGESRICVAQQGYAPRSVARFTLASYPAIELGVTSVTFRADQQPLARAALTPETRHYSLLLSSTLQDSDDLCVTITSATVLEQGTPRQLGVPVLAFELRRLPGAGLALPSEQQAWLNLALALLVFWLLRLLGAQRMAAAGLVGGVTLLVGAAVWSGELIPGIDTVRNMQPVVGIAALLCAGVLTMRGGHYLLQRSARFNQRLSHDLLQMLGWSLLLVGSVHILQLVYTHSGAWPLKAGIWPTFTPLVAVPLALWAGWLALLLHMLRQSHPDSRAGLLLLLAGAIVLPVALKVSARGWELLYFTFHNNPSDYIFDVPLVGSDPLGFLGRYVAISPTLAWHNSNHPPGSVLLLWVVARLIGPGAVPATWVVIVLSSLSVLAACWLGQRLGGVRLALLAGALMVVMPGHQVYSVTSMDAIFNALNALAAVGCWLALQPGAQRWRAVAAGGLLALALFFTYATTQLFFFGAALALLALLQGQSWRVVLRQGLLVVATLVGLYLLLYLLSGFNVIAGVLQAKANNARLLADDPGSAVPRLLGLPTVEHYLFFLGVNIVPFAWYLGPWGLAALTPVLRASLQQWRKPQPVHMLALALLTLVLGMWLSGLFLREVERIWGFVYPLAAALMAWHIWQGETQHERLWRAGLYVSLFFAQSVVMRFLLNTYW